MFDAAAPLNMQRTRGRASVGVQAAGGRTRLRDLHQSGSAKAFLPNVHGPVPEVVFLNTAGGLTGGDHLRFSMAVDDGARALGTTQTAERAYASSGGAARLDMDLRVAAGGRLDWLPQETILFNRSTLSRTTEVLLAGDAVFLFVEMVVLGRAAMGEAVRDLHFRDMRRISRDGCPVMIEPLEITRETLLGSDLATLDGARAVATVGLIAPGAEDALGPLRAALPDHVPVAASAWDGKCIARLMAPDAYPLRRAVAAILTTLRQAPLPRVWQL